MTSPERGCAREMTVVVLTGLMGTGKSSVGRRLAARLGTAFIDTDERIAASAGMSVPAIRATLGESHFQQIQSRVLADVLRDGSVVAIGDSAILDPVNEARMHEAGAVICLMADVDVILGRSGEASGRPRTDSEARRARVNSGLFWSGLAGAAIYHLHLVRGAKLEANCGGWAFLAQVWATHPGSHPITT